MVIAALELLREWVVNAGGSTATPSSLLSDGITFQKAESRSLQICAAQLLCQINQAFTPMASCNVNTLLSSGAAFQKCSDRELQICLCQLLCNVAAVAGAGGATVGSGEPEGSVTGAVGALYYDLVTGFFYIKATGTGNTGWVIH